MNKQNKNIEAIYPLSPMQQGMLFHTLYAPNSGVYFEQLICTLTGKLNLLAFEQAWQKVIERHSALRTLFVWKQQKQPLQVVLKSVSLPWLNLDWRQLSQVEQQQRSQALLQIEREQGFKLNHPPLMRCTLIQVQEDTYHFIWSHHHLLMDGWCLSILFKEVLAYYESVVECHELYLPPSFPYKNYISWLQKQDRSQAEVFWRQSLQGFTTPTHLINRVVEDQFSQKQIYAEQRQTLSKILIPKLQSLAQKHHLTLNTLIQGAWALLLSRYTRESDVVFGTTVSGRPTDLSGVESMVGLFINTLPVRVQLSEDAELFPWLKQLQAQQVESEQYSYSSLIDIQTWSDVPRGTPLFESLVVFENYPLDESLREGSDHIKITNIHGFERTNYPLTLVAYPGSEFSLLISYDTNRFDADTISRILGNLQMLLEGFVAHPQQRLSEFPLLTAAERHQQLIAWNDTETEYPHQKCIHELFEAQVELTPNAIAVVLGNEQLTYQELNHRANQLAHHLQVLGVGPEVLVGICVERSLEIVVGLLAVLKVGGAYVPLDPAYPQERLAFMLADSQVPVLLTQSHLVANLPEHQAYIFNLDTDWGVISEQSRENLLSNAVADNLAYVIYTSGSTGKPKGVLVPHKGLCNLAQAQAKIFHVQPESRVLQFASWSFDASISEVVMTLCSGARLYLGTPEALLPGQNLVQLLREHSITHVTLPPSALAAMPWEKLPNLQNIIVAGEVCSLNLVRQWSEGRRFLNAYGPTEATVCATITECTDSYRQPPIGRPIANTKIYILDQHRQPVPIGVAGELYIGGVGVARGYLNRPELTKEKFLPNPFSDQPGERLYKTGDLACYLSDGNIEFLGRIDDQVKIRGFRIELGEIEALLKQHPQVQEAVAIARSDQPNDQRIVAYVVPTQEQNITTNEIRNFLKDKLPHYVVPSAFVLMNLLPLTPNGKIDRRALPAPDQTRPDLETTYAAPRNNVETNIVTVWQEVLHLEKVGIHDNFFELGGNSLLMIQVHDKLQQIIDQDISLVDLFRYPTISILAQYFSEENNPEKTDHLQQIQDRTRKQKEAIQKQKQLMQQRRKA